MTAVLYFVEILVASSVAMVLLATSQLRISSDAVFFAAGVVEDPSSPGISASLNGLGAEGLLVTINAGFDYQIMPLFVVEIFGDYDFHHLKSDLDLNVSSGHGITARLSCSFNFLTIRGLSP
jgi:hypothetical protein